jgi:xylan 1,4-beta-xylosidase
VWNYAPPGVGGISKPITLLLSGFTGPRQARIQMVDRDHGSALAAWLAMGKPDFPSRAQQDALRKAAQLPRPEVRALSSEGTATLTLTIEPQGLALVEISAR